MKLTKQHLAFVLAIALSSVIITGFLMYIRNPNSFTPQQACTADAMMCPDGSSVGRSGPNCEFSPCPSSDALPELIDPGTDSDEGVFCTADAKICPDGSAVGRSGPDCEFAACPTELSQTIHLSEKIEGFNLKSYSIAFSKDWSKNHKREEKEFDFLELSKKNHSLIINQGAYGGGSCLYEGDAPKPTDDYPLVNFTDYRNKNFVELETSFGTLRRQLSLYNPNTYTFCHTDMKNSSFSYATVSPIGAIEYKIPENPDQSIMLEMDKIIQSIKVVQ